VSQKPNRVVLLGREKQKMLQPEGGEGGPRRRERERETIEATCPGKLKMDFVQLLVDMYGSSLANDSCIILWHDDPRQIYFSLSLLSRNHSEKLR
jgi:hypothetical protein